MFSLSDIQYGNPSAEILPYLKGESFLDALFAELSSLHFPANDSNAAREELNTLLEYTKQLENNGHLKKRCFDYDENIYNFFLKISFEKDDEKTKEYHSTIESLFMDCLPLIYKLKLTHNRPRPFQLAGYHKLKLFPPHSYSINSPSFPSMYAAMAAVVAGVCGNHYPDIYKWFDDLKHDIGYSRLYMATNFPSDVDSGFNIAAKILENKEFKIKYKL